MHLHITNNRMNVLCMLAMISKCKQGFDLDSIWVNIPNEPLIEEHKIYA